MSETVMMKISGLNKSVYFSAETLRKIKTLGVPDTLSAFIKELVDEKFFRQQGEISPLSPALPPKVLPPKSVKKSASANGRRGKKAS